MTDPLAAAIRHTIDTKTKPLGALGRIESLAEQIALLQGTVAPVMQGCTLTIFAADHGIAESGVSAFPQAVTGQMVLNFLAGGAAANVFARVNGVALQVVDAGVAGEAIAHPGLVNRRIGPGTANFLTGPAMTAQQAEAALIAGKAIAATAKGEALAFNAITGELLRAPPPTRTSLLVQKVMAGLHFAQFGGYPMRWLYFICGLVSSAMIASGLVLYTVKRRRQSAAQGLWLRQVEWLNLACVGGLMLACVALLWANRLLPADLAEREGWELRVFFGAWLAALLHARLRAPLRGWLEQLAASAVLLLGLPLLDLQTALAVPDRIRLGVDLTGFGLGALLALVAWKVSKRPTATVRAARRTPAAMVEVQS